MKVISIPLEGEEKALDSALNCLKKEELIVYPTDTVYGLGADATNQEAVEKVFSVKNRSPDQPVSVLVSDFKMLGEHALIDSDQAFLLHQLLPGRVTVVLEAREKLASNLSPDRSIGFRVPLHPFCVRLVGQLGKPITSTSANLSGKDFPRSIEEAVQQLGEKVSLYLDQGRRVFEPSTVIDLRGKPEVLREGAGLKKIREILG